MLTGHGSPPPWEFPPCRYKKPSSYRTTLRERPLPSRANPTPLSTLLGGARGHGGGYPLQDGGRRLVSVLRLPRVGRVLYLREISRKYTELSPSTLPFLTLQFHEKDPPPTPNLLQIWPILPPLGHILSIASGRSFDLLVGSLCRHKRNSLVK